MISFTTVDGQRLAFPKGSIYLRSDDNCHYAANIYTDLYWEIDPDESQR